MANKYEMIVVLSPVLGEEGSASVTESIKAKLETGATIENQQTLGMKRLAYEINDQKEGLYLQFNFSAESEFPKELDRVLKITEGVLRHLIIRTDE